ncbi:MAG: hypothetical protein IPK39_23625 [Sulfuritalea sp.]|nr:hypothetical protein [Sulfuritalea sp.]
MSFYARNDHLELSIPYEYFGIAHSSFGFLVRLAANWPTLLLEIKGEEARDGPGQAPGGAALGKCGQSLGAARNLGVSRLQRPAEGD